MHILNCFLTWECLLSFGRFHIRVGLSTSCTNLTGSWCSFLGLPNMQLLKEARAVMFLLKWQLKKGMSLTEGLLEVRHISLLSSAQYLEVSTFFIVRWESCTLETFLERGFFVLFCFSVALNSCKLGIICCCCLYRLSHRSFESPFISRPPWIWDP